MNIIFSNLLIDIIFNFNYINKFFIKNILT